jgi:hypothetical protein
VTQPVEARSGLDPWVSTDLPEPPNPKGLQWLKVVGPGVIVLGVSIGSGEFLLGPAAFVKTGFSLLWVCLVAVFLQTVFNTELMRYTIATGEPVFTGFMRTRPDSKLWSGVYALLYFLQVGWPAHAGTAAGAIFFLLFGQLARPEDRPTIYLIGIIAFLGCIAILLVGRRIERTLELLNWVMVVVIMGGLLILALMLVPAETWGSALAGFIGYDTTSSSFQFVPAGSDLFLLGALAAYSGAGGVNNLVLSNWARDRGYGMGEKAGYIPAAVGGTKVNLAHTGFIFPKTDDNMRRWRGWWRVISADQWWVFGLGAVLGMMLPALLYVTFVPRGTDIQGLGISAALASNMMGAKGALMGGIVAMLGAWILFKTQLDITEGMSRALTDMLWSGSKRLRAWRGGDVRRVYYTVLVVLVIWGAVALRLAQPIVLLKIGANVAGVVMVVSSLQLLYVNTTLLPVHVRPPMWRRVCLVVMALFYGTFAYFAFTNLK